MGLSLPRYSLRSVASSYALPMLYGGDVTMRLIAPFGIDLSVSAESPERFAASDIGSNLSDVAMLHNPACLVCFLSIGVSTGTCLFLPIRHARRRVGLCNATEHDTAAAQCSKRNRSRFWPCLPRFG